MQCRVVITLGPGHTSEAGILGAESYGVNVQGSLMMMHPGKNSHSLEQQL